MSIDLPEFPNLVGDPDPTLVGKVGVVGTIFARRFSIKQSGVLHDLALAHTKPGGTGFHARLMIFDVGVTAPSAYTLLWESGSVELTNVEEWQILGDPARIVTAGQVLDFAVMLDSLTPEIGRKTIASSPLSLLPNAAYMPSGGTALPKRQWSYAAGAYAASPAQVTEAQAQTTSGLICPTIFGRVA